jgi:hypothetical protein
MMSIRSSMVSLVAILAGCALACCGAPKGFELGTVAIDLSGADGTVNLYSLEHGSSEQVALRAGETRLARVPAGAYSVELVPGTSTERVSEPASIVRAVIIVASGQVTALRFAVEGGGERELMAAAG